MQLIDLSLSGTETIVKFMGLTYLPSNRIKDGKEAYEHMGDRLYLWEPELIKPKIISILYPKCEAYSLANMEYHLDYNWLMPVWFKFKELQIPEEHKEGFEYWLDRISRRIIWSKDDPLPGFCALVDAINWYNSIGIIQGTRQD